MDWLIWGGAALSALGVVGIFVSIVLIQRARRTAADDEDLRSRIQRVLPLNLGAFFISVLGLMAVVVGIILG